MHFLYLKLYYHYHYLPYPFPEKNYENLTFLNRLMFMFVPLANELKATRCIIAQAIPLGIGELRLEKRKV